MKTGMYVSAVEKVILEQKIKEMEKIVSTLERELHNMTPDIEKGKMDSTKRRMQVGILQLQKELYQLLATLEKTKKTKEIFSNEVEIGSHFEATLHLPNDTIEKRIYVLRNRTDIGSENLKGVRIVFTDTPFGRAVIYKKENDFFSYQTSSGIINGEVNVVLPNHQLEQKKR